MKPELELANNYWSYIWINTAVTFITIVLLVILLMTISSVLYKHWTWFRIKYRQLFYITDEDDHIF